MIHGLGRSHGEGNGNPFQLFWPGEFHGLRSLVGYSSWSHKESDTSEQLSTSVHTNTHTHTHTHTHRVIGLYVLSTQIIHKEQTRNKTFKSYGTYLEKYSSEV